MIPMIFILMLSVPRPTTNSKENDMQYKCEVCHDTGNKEKDMGGHLTCIACSAATDRAALEAFIEKLPAMGEQEQAWRIHQRALAMAPKQEADHINDVVKMVAPAAANGAMPELPKPDVTTLGHRKFWSEDQMRAYGQACAAAGPDAGPKVESIDCEEFRKLADDYHCVQEQEKLESTYDALRAYVDSEIERQVRAALSGAKGN